MLNRKLTGALAWGGLAVILAVPSADILSAKMAAPAAAPDAITTASIDGASVTVPVVKPVLAPVPVKGKPMPSYISDPGPETAAVKPVAPKAPEQTAAVSPEPVPPTPMPAHMRPLPPSTGPQPTQATQPAQPTQVATVQQPPTATQPLILDEQQVLANEAALDSEPQPLRPKKDVPRPPALVTEDELEGWDSGSLADYLERRGLLSDASYSEEYVGDETYDPDGFYLSDGPNKKKRKARRGPPDRFVVFPFD